MASQATGLFLRPEEEAAGGAELLLEKRNRNAKTSLRSGSSLADFGSIVSYHGLCVRTASRRPIRHVSLEEKCAKRLR